MKYYILYKAVYNVATSLVHGDADADADICDQETHLSRSLPRARII